MFQRLAMNVNNPRCVSIIAAIKDHINIYKIVETYSHGNMIATLLREKLQACGRDILDLIYLESILYRC